MPQYMVPTDSAFIEEVAKAIARERLTLEAKGILIESGVPDEMVTMLDNSIDKIFEKLWNGESDLDGGQKSGYKRCTNSSKYYKSKAYAYLRINTSMRPFDVKLPKY